MQWHRWFPYFIAMMPRAVSHALADIVALFFMRRSWREAAAVDVTRAGIPPKNARATARRLFQNYGRFMIDYFHMPRVTPGRLWSYFHPPRTVPFETGQSYVLVTPHLGHWELGGAFLQGIGLPLSVGTAAMSGDAQEQLRVRFRKSVGIETISLSDASGSALLAFREAIGRGRSVALLVEREFPGPDLEVEWMGSTQRFSLGPAALARSCDVPLVVVGVPLGKNGRYDLVVEEIIQSDPELMPSEDREQMTRKMVSAVERLIRRHPDQWYQFGQHTVS